MWLDRLSGHIWAEAWNEGAFYSPDGMTIQFDNGTVWHRVVEVPVVAPMGRDHQAADRDSRSCVVRGTVMEGQRPGPINRQAERVERDALWRA